MRNYVYVSTRCSVVILSAKGYDWLEHLAQIVLSATAKLSTETLSMQIATDNNKNIIIMSLHNSIYLQLISKALHEMQNTQWVIETDW